MPVIVIRNPVAGRRRAALVDAVCAALEARGAAVALRTTTRAGEAASLAEEAARQGAARIVVAGGDGSINDAVRGLLRAGPAAPPLAIIPLGHANVLAHEIGWPRDAAAIARAIVEGPVRAITLGTANGRPFLAMAGVGFDARVVAALDVALKRRLGRLAYVWGSLCGLATFDFPAYEVTIAGKRMRAASVIAANARRYGGRYPLAPAAELAAPTLEVCLFEQGGRGAVLRYGAALLAHRLPRAAGLRIVTATQLRIDGPPGDPVQADGDIVARLPVDIAVRAAALRLVYPPGSG